MMTVVPHTPRKKKTPKTNRRKTDTVKRSQFYKAVDTRGVKLLKLVYQKENIKKSIEDYWLTQRRRIISEIAYRRTGAFRIEQPLKIPDEKLTAILDPKNEARNEGYKRQIEIFSLEYTVRYLQISLRTRKANAKLYKKIKYKWVS